MITSLAIGDYVRIREKFAHHYEDGKSATYIVEEPSSSQFNGSWATAYFRSEEATVRGMDIARLRDVATGAHVFAPWKWLEMARPLEGTVLQVDMRGALDGRAPDAIDEECLAIALAMSGRLAKLEERNAQHLALAERTIQSQLQQLCEALEITYVEGAPASAFQGLIVQVRELKALRGASIEGAKDAANQRELTMRAELAEAVGWHPTEVRKHEWPQMLEQVRVWKKAVLDRNRHITTLKAKLDAQKTPVEILLEYQRHGAVMFTADEVAILREAAQRTRTENVRGHHDPMDRLFNAVAYRVGELSKDLVLDEDAWKRFVERLELVGIAWKTGEA